MMGFPFQTQALPIGQEHHIKIVRLRIYHDVEADA
jgi:hypothetical protein